MQATIPHSAVASRLLWAQTVGLTTIGRGCAVSPAANQGQAHLALVEVAREFTLTSACGWWYNIDMANAKLNQMAVELIPDPGEGGFTARVPDIPAYGEGETEDAAIADLKEALRGYITTFGMDDALQRLNTPIKLRFVEMDLAELGRA
ncbi:MAG: type II toxin-antitoxin system HicB family antitoxin [Planctomycetes bacterium]|nr:type II toxin-antitoxin system HicB family antitoxin [Planctomycetota bacterium]